MNPDSFSHFRTPRDQGFTLIEIAIVLVIMALLTAVGIRMLTSMSEGLRVRATRQNIDTVKQALQSYVARAGRLPCPAIEGNAPTSATYGIEAPTSGTCTGSTAIGSPTNAFRGVVPWKSLGMTADNAFDAWGNQITYVVTNTATGLNSGTLGGMRGSLWVHSATPVAAGLPATGNQINACSTTAGDNLCNAAAAVILISYGSASGGAFTSNGTRIPLPTSAQEIENTNTDRSYVLPEPSPNFDDIVVPLSPNDLLGPLFVQGIVRPPQALLLDRARQVISLLAAEAVSNSGGGDYDLPTPASTVAYTFDGAKFNSDCNSDPPGVVGFPPTGVRTLTSQILDPWGNEFRYARAENSIDSGENCITPAALVSMGPDATLGTADDWIYYSPMAEWKAIFEKAGW